MSAVKRMLLLIIVLVSSGYGIQHQEIRPSTAQKIVLSFDIDDVISGKTKVGLKEYATLIPRMLFWNPKLAIALLPHNYKQIGQISANIQKTTQGSTNIIHGVNEWIKAHGYGDLSFYEPQMVARSQKPYPVMPMINAIKKFKAQGYTVIGATNQDHMQHQAYRAYMLRYHNIDLNELFDAVLTTHVHHVDMPAGSGLIYRVNAKDNMYATRRAQDCKPHTGYFNAVQELVKQIAPDAVHIMHTDDKLENVQAAQSVGISGIHFNLAAGTIRKSTPSEIVTTFDLWQKDLATHEIS